jgi:hypothetical protein
MRRIATILLALLLALCLISAIGGLAYLIWPRDVARPVVLIGTPSYGERVAVGERIVVHAVARDEARVTRVELWVDGELQESQASTVPGGISPFPLTAQWEPESPGTHRLTARAFDAEGRRAHASIEVEAVAEADGDGDGVADEVDACPDELGWRASAGCPDGDFDGIPDSEDACPEVAGLPDGDGCPAPSERDGDGDGVVDEVDACPDAAGPPVAEGCPDADGDRVGDADDACPTEPGWQENDGCQVEGDVDFDGVADGEDECPEEWGLPEHFGCADDDGDGVADRYDACVDEAGLPYSDGCPDRDGDGVADGEDLRPDEPGLPEDHGAPDTGAPDSDGDGVPDDVDECDEEEGLPEHFGCPPPGEAEDADGDGIADDEEMAVSPLDGLLSYTALYGLAPKAEVPVEFQAMEFEAARDYESIACYVRVGREDPAHVGPLDPLGERLWSIPRRLGSLFTAFDDEDYFPVYVECEGSHEEEFCRDGECIRGTQLDNLGVFIGGEPDPDDPESVGYPVEDWDGHVITGRSGRGEPGDWFQVKFRICTPSCEEAVHVLYVPPLVELTQVGEDTRLLIMEQWADGIPEGVWGWNVYIDGNYVFPVPLDRESVSVDYYEPACGETRVFQATVRGRAGESRLGPYYRWEGEWCPRTVQVEFYSLETGDLGGDQGHHSGVGPISGNFRVTAGGRTHRLEFDAVDPGTWAWEETRGYRLRDGREYLIHDIFQWIWRRMNCAGGGCPDYGVPANNCVTVDLGPEDDLTFGGSIYDHDDDPPSDTMFDAEYTIRAEDISEHTSGECLVPGYCVIEDRNITLTVLLSTIGW